MPVATSDPGRGRSAGWLSWLLGAALLITVITAALHASEAQAFAGLAEHAEPWWLLGAMTLQAGTYIAQGRVWRLVSAAAGVAMSRRTAFELALAKLFADQALPSAGLSSSILIAKALEQRQLPIRAVNASVLVNIVSYHLAYAAALLAALILLVVRGNTNALVMATAVSFLFFSAGLSGAALALAGRRQESRPRAVAALRALRTLADFAAGADARLVRSPRVLAETVAIQGTIVLLDTATVWTLIRALGATASISGVFVSFMIASLFRTMGIMPGGLGTFEATSVLMLRTIGTDLPVALASTMLFRGLSFWLPMLPGYWCSRRLLRHDRGGVSRA